MGLFSQKYCDICGDKIGLLGNKKLEDGNMCKNCGKKLSPWFNERRSSSQADIKEQLAYREENKKRVSAFHTTRSLGINTKILIDEDAGKIMVTSAKDLLEANPDVLDFTDVTGCLLDIDETKTEITREDKDGKQVSYLPRRYDYSFDFYIALDVNNPYFSQIRFKLNTFSVDGKPPRQYQEHKEMGDEICRVLNQLTQKVHDPVKKEEDPESIVETNTKKTPVLCPYCGGSATSPDSKYCEFCGGALGQ
ncbi:MAG: DUF4428 domain-containing protein [Clostridium sp.]|nr:DUF4428 domain-containing protein [Clostridium sp.]